MPKLNFENHFKDLFENTSDLIHFLSIDGTIELVNPAWLNTLEYQLDEVVGKSIYDFIHPPCIEEYRALREKAIATKEKSDIITTFLTRSKKEVVGDRKSVV